MKHFYQALILLLVLGMSATDLLAQTYPRATSGAFGNLRLGATTYNGDRDADLGTKMWKPQFSDAGFGLGFEAGMILSPAFSLSIGYQFGKYSRLAENTVQVGQDAVGGENLFPELTDETSQNRGTIPLLLRWMILPKSNVSPYLNLGGNLTLGSHDPRLSDKVMEAAFGPSFGLGFDLVVSRHNSIFLETTRHLTFNDFKVDAGESTVPDDGSDPTSNSSFDALQFWGVGLRHSLKPACGPPVIESLSVPDRVDIGQPTPLSATINEDACQPVDISWDLGGGAMLSGMGASHMFDTPGERSITVTATNGAGSVSRTATINVIDPCPIDAEIIAINLNPSDPIINESITFSADVRGTAPLTYSWDFGDGTMGSGSRASHMYSEPGEYTVSLSCSNCGGEDSRSINIVVREFRCDDITELNSVFFSSNSAELDESATSLLVENVAVLDECSDKLVRVDAYADRGERSPQSLSNRRASAVEQYYIDNGISASRVMSRGLGRDPLAGKGVDGTRNRRADSIIVDSFE
jgi:PKD repeat protein